ncbi:uncharacterized protein LOC134190984 [Corticium candelabrum]|uniref:uncharacterized protein LOC134190984 n=1 Tax=Corticium candelabrum TaxID=121492 RepID=UPI002E253F8B|nr:uncharacterized protein LOC134190984 [Corticium candelabrum]
MYSRRETVHSIQIGDRPPRLCWTAFISLRFPSAWRRDEVESPDIHRNSYYPVCEQPKDVDCRTHDGRLASETSDVLNCTVETGLMCMARDQPNGRHCQHDYKVRYLCECDCRQTLRGTHGNVTVPGRSIYTYRQLKCRWKIKTSPKRIIILKFKEMWKASSNNYYGDSQLTIFDGLNMSSSLVLAKLDDFTSEQWKTTTLMSSGSTMTVKLKTRRRLQRHMSFLYTAEKFPAKWKLCDFNKDKCGWTDNDRVWIHVKCKKKSDNEMLTNISCSSGGILTVRKKNVTRRNSYVIKSPLYKSLSDTCLRMRYRNSMPNGRFTVSMWTLNHTYVYKFSDQRTTKWANATIPVPNGQIFRVVLRVTLGKSLKWKIGDLAIDGIRKAPCFVDTKCTFNKTNVCSHIRVRSPTKRRAGWVHEKSDNTTMTENPSTRLF